MNFESGKYSGQIMQRIGDYESIVIYEEGKKKLELRVSGTAIANQPCGLNEDTIHEWLWKTGLEIAEDMEHKETEGARTILSVDVVSGKLNTPWKNLRKDRD